MKVHFSPISMQNLKQHVIYLNQYFSPWDEKFQYVWCVLSRKHCIFPRQFMWLTDLHRALINSRSILITKYAKWKELIAETSISPTFKEDIRTSKLLHSNSMEILNVRWWNKQFAMVNLMMTNQLFYNFSLLRLCTYWHDLCDNFYS